MRAGEGTTGGWGITAANADPRFSFDLDDAAATTLAKPGSYSISQALPGGVSLVSLEQLDLSTPSCADAAADPATAADSCWIELSAAERQDFQVAAGSHHVLRLLAASAQDMPMLPVTGGVGTDAFILASFGCGLLALVAYLAQRRRTGV